MLVDFICPHGHRWQTQESQSGAAECPECGSTGERFEVTIHGANDEITLDATSQYTRAGRKHAPAPRADQSPPNIPGYVVFECLGRGGMGAVFRAKDTRLNREVALKIIALGPNPRQEDLLRFQIEAESLASLQHPNVVQVYDVGEVGNQPYLAMELVDGPSLEGYLQDYTPSPSESANMCRKIALAVHATHLRGIVHRDLKPANILIAEGTVPKLTDFGLAKRIETDSDITRPGMVVGTPSYMAPEQAEGESNAVGPRSDVYALGAILYEMLAGRKPFVADSVLRTLEMIRVQEPSPPSRHGVAIPRDLETICLKCLEKQPERRYESAAALADDLQRFLSGEPVVARPLGAWEAGLKWGRRHPAIAASMLLVAMGILAGSIGAAWHHHQIVTERDATQQYFDLSLEAVEVLMVEMAEENFTSNPYMNNKREAILETALEFYGNLYAQRMAMRDAQVNIAEMKVRQGDVNFWLERFDESDNAYEVAFDMLTRAETGPDQMHFLADAHKGYGQLCYRTGRVDQAIESFRTAIDIYRDLSDDHGLDDEFLADVAGSQQHLAVCLIDNGEHGEAEKILRKAIEILEAIAVRENMEHHIVHDLAKSHLTLGTVMREVKQHDKVESFYARAIELFEYLHESHPHNAKYHSHLSQAVANLGNHHVSLGNYNEAEVHLTRAHREQSELTDLYHTHGEYRHALANTLNSLAFVHYIRGNQGDSHDAEEIANARKRFEEAESHLRSLLDETTRQPELEGRLGMTLVNLAQTQILTDELASAADSLARGRQHLTKARAALPKREDFLQSTEEYYLFAAVVLVRSGDFGKALQQGRAVTQAASASSTDAMFALAYFDSLFTEIDEAEVQLSPKQIGELRKLAGEAVDIATKSNVFGDEVTLESTFPSLGKELDGE